MIQCCCSSHRPSQTSAAFRPCAKIDNHRRQSEVCWCWCGPCWSGLYRNEWTRREFPSHFRISTCPSSACCRTARSSRDFPSSASRIPLDRRSSCCDNKFRLHVHECWSCIRRRCASACSAECSCRNLRGRKKSCLEAFGIGQSLITIRWRTAALTRRRLFAIRTVVGRRVLVAVPAGDAALLVSGARAVLPFAVAPATVVLVLALSVLDGTWLGAFARALGVAVGARDVPGRVAGAAATRALDLWRKKIGFASSFERRNFRQGGSDWDIFGRFWTKT